MHDLTFSTAISGQTPSGLQIRGKSLKKLIAEPDFAATLYLSITGMVPTPKHSLMMNAILVAALDPGLEPASGFVPRVAISSGAEMTTAIATSILVLGPRHGAAVTAAMELFETIIETKSSIDSVAQQTIAEYRKNGKRLPGYGNPKKRQSDERALALFALARRSELPMVAFDVALTIETALEEQMGRKLPINVDGAIAAVLVSMGINATAGNALYAIARAAGSIAHCMEELAQKNGVRRLRAEQIEYTHEQ